ncbi:bifunctional 3,4-dihydroxy-2-butanone-4-phosphate synthase/GTP cyclohydrolase II [Moraxella sp. FZFQ2102]|uniref:bifunctional 3,4-dihydroxy-2-butanone-4-phosphate synthase/GTP cyclohydrolase II n=1 Tax=Moraxella sp. FZFQ2102 TaxID=2953752 RepID=UPI00209C1024|nr:bifunctional 3,4-dihydroxy-2-butanone-4-phosphate synthase/GTP cyclohydrolase II [Moraxella sp. FZFQ2102]USZ13876.1 bifunctional 3,4-dihydroxy-2-butanone-4-phosphate synthase/GTP cyclohydrolase II [Moraxella sp. FZFQ2102]
MAMNSISEIIEDIKQGKMVILMDDEDRENEGDLIMAASHITPEAINFMITHARGLVCLTLTEERCKQLDLPLMSDKNGAKFSTNFTLSIEAAEGVTTGISASDRATTVRAAVAANAKPADIVQPGHIFPIMARKGGVLHRAGHTEAGCDLARLAGLEPASVIVEIIKPDGEMARRDDLEIFAKEHGLKIGTIADLIQYRMATEQTVSEVEHFEVETAHGAFTAYRFSEFGSEDVHLAFVKGTPTAGGVSTVRVHSFSPMKDLFGIHTTGSHWTIHNALAEISDAEHGVLVWIGHGDELGLADAFDTLKNPSQTSSKNRRAPYQTIGVGAQILKHLGVKDMRLLSSPVKFNALSGFDLNVVETVEKTC